MKENTSKEMFVKGVEATYRPDPLIFGGPNPFLEALPPLLKENEVMDLFYNVPSYPESMRGQDAMTR